MTCSYGTVSWTSLYKSSVAVRPIPDDSARTTMVNEVTVLIDGKVVAQPTDVTMASLQKVLTAHGSELIYTGKGFPLHVNGDSEVKDARFGPSPEILEFQPLGGDCNAARVIFRVKTWLPFCDNAKYTDFPMQMSFSVAQRQDKDNYSTEDVTGVLEIPMTRTAAGAVPDSVDRFRELLESDVPLGFRRENAVWQISSDRRRLDFSWSDVELPVAPPEWVSSIDARHTMRSTLKDGFKVWTMTISANITPPRGVVRSHALMALRWLVLSRTQDLTKQGFSIIPQVMEFTENVFGKESSFVWVGMILPRKDATIGKTLNASRLWYPLGSDYARWRKSLADVRANTTRGWADLRVPADVIVDLCDTGGTQALVSVDAPGNAPNNRGLVPDDKGGEDFQLQARNLQPDNSWLRFEMDLNFEEDPRAIRHKLLPADPPLDTSDAFNRVEADGDRRLIEDAVGAPGSQADGQDDDAFQRVGKPTRTLVLTGWATRVGFRIPVPKIEDVGGVEPVELSRQVRERTLGAMAGQPVYQSVWRIVYGLPSAPTGPLPALANPVKDTDGGQLTLQGFTTQA